MSVKIDWEQWKKDGKLDQLINVFEAAAGVEFRPRSEN